MSVVTSELNPEFWRRCSSCKNPIAYSASHFVCSVSTCNRKRIGYVFDTVHCWERHLPGARHRDAAAVESKAPTYRDWKAELDGEKQERPTPDAPLAAAASAPRNRVIARTPTGLSVTQTLFKDALESETLVFVSKLKNYVRERSEMNTSDSVVELLSNRLRRMCDRAIENARADGRKTVMDRDFEKL